MSVSMDVHTRAHICSYPFILSSLFFFSLLSSHFPFLYFSIYTSFIFFHQWIIKLFHSLFFSLLSIFLLFFFVLHSISFECELVHLIHHVLVIQLHTSRNVKCHERNINISFLNVESRMSNLESRMLNLESRISNVEFSSYHINSYHNPKKYDIRSNASIRTYSSSLIFDLFIFHLCSDRRLLTLPLS